MTDVTTNPGMPPKANGLAAASASALAATPPVVNTLQAAMKTAEAAITAALLPAGRCNLTVTDVATGDPSGFVGWTVIRCGCADAEEHGELALFLPSYIAPEAIIDDGDGGSVFDPALIDAKAARGIVSGLNRLNKLCTIGGIDPASIAGPDDMPVLIGVQFEAIVAVGRDRDGLPANSIRQIVGPVKVPTPATPPTADAPAPSAAADVDYDPNKPNDVPF